MKYDFDMEVDRRNSHSLKWEFMHTGEKLTHTTRFLGESRVLPMWVADMDFVSPKPVVDALIKRAQQGIYGYTAPTQPFYNSLVRWMKRRHDWRIEPEWICITPGVVPALNMLVRSLVSPGDKVLIQPPVYHPFYRAIENNGAEPALNPLALEDDRYRMDFADLEAKCRDPKVKLAFLCSPHNPVGRVWTREELIRFGEICMHNNIPVVSDEIHGDLIHEDHIFTPFAHISNAFSENSITCTSPSKTFNLAGLRTSCIIIPNGNLRSGFEKVLQANGLFGVDAFGAVAFQAAYDHGEEWLAQLLEYIGGNLEYLERYVAQHIPRLKVISPEGTYLVWLDCRGLGLGRKALRKLMLESARIYLDDGFIFGPEGECFERINIACPRSILAEALDRIRGAVAGLPQVPD